MGWQNFMARSIEINLIYAEPISNACYFKHAVRRSSMTSRTSTCAVKGDARPPSEISHLRPDGLISRRAVLYIV